ncbi:outer membrane protein, OMP85 family [Rhodospirillum centenum SW]|uniref:Outer membrane protein, OMP85 family n=2 Tax=Rhodospirillum centenum TaxID=34018 RepID=B6IY94_RHOCS|nr:outer membrane protein, OMP85 family [Rhodospirillum centenum SW]
MSDMMPPPTARQAGFPIRFLPLLVLLALPVLLTQPKAARAQETPYTVELTGLDGTGDVRGLLEEVSRLVALRDQPPPSPIGLRRRAEADRDRLAAALRSEGYFAAVLDIDVDTGASPATVTVRVRPGQRYTIGTVSVRTTSGEVLPGGAIAPGDVGLPPGSPARGAAVMDAEDRLRARLAAEGYAYARVLDRRVLVDHARQAMDIDFTVLPGPLVQFGEVSVSGLDTVGGIAVRRRLPWKRGDRYDPALMDKAQESLTELGVFNSVRLALGPEPAQGTEAPVNVVVREQDMRFIGFGFDYSTSEGFGANAYWGHRNLLGGAERLRVGAEISGIARDANLNPTDYDYNLNVLYREPDFLSRGQSLSLSGEILSERPDAYRRDAVVLSAIVERPLTDSLTGSLGVTFEQSRVEDGLRETTNTLVGVPAAVTWDRSNDLLNPTSGFRLSALVTPYVVPFGDSDNFTVSRLTGSTYWDLTGSGDYVAAGRLSYGSIFGSTLAGVPADKRFYAGGGGSIRGYGYQEVGPKAPDGDPLGGKSLIEASVELRIKVTDSIGIVPFVDAGNVYDETFPDFGEELRWGAGIGARYYTGIGPIRVDFAVPLNKQEGDSSFQFYVSIGQAF